MGRMAVMLRRPGACPPPRSILLLLLVVACAAGFIHASQSNENAGQYPSIAKEPVPIVLPLLHLPKRSAQNPHPFTAEEVDDDELFQTRSSPEPPLRPIAHTYQTLDCYGRWKFRALLDDASAASGYKVHNGTVPLCDNTAEFYAQIGVGTPPQYFYVQVDTGSSLFAVPVAGCKSCAGHASDRYHRNMSSTSQGYSCADIFHCTAMRCYGQTFDCGFHSQYQDQSYINGMILKEKITFANRTFDGMFGAIYEAAGTFSATSQVDGILGLSYFSDLSCLPNCVPPLWDSMVSAFNLPDVFALDLPEPNMGVAQLILGGTGRARPSELNWTPIMQESYYVVDLKEIGVGGVPIQFDPADMGQVIVDSGTTLLILPRPIFEALKEGFLSGNCSVEGICEHARHGDNIFNTCFDSKTLSEKTNNYSLYPSISFKFPGVQVDLNPHQYLRTQMRSSQPCVEMAVAPIDNTLTILGDTFMRDRVTVFDRANKRVGFTNAKPYTWNAPPAEAWVWWTIACSLSGFTLFCTFVLGLFVYGARRYKRRRTPHYEPLLLAGDELGELAEDLDFTLPVSSSSSRPLRAGAGGGSGDLLLNPALDNEHHHSSSSDDEVLPPPSTSPAHHDVVVA